MGWKISILERAITDLTNQTIPRYGCRGVTGRKALLRRQILGLVEEHVALIEQLKRDREILKGYGIER
jgi:hypothetical protein